MASKEGVGDRVRRYRRFLRLTQEELAGRAEIDRSYLGKIEAGDVAEPGVETLRRLARALKIPLRSLAEPLGWYDDEAPSPSDWKAAIRADRRFTDETAEAIIKVVEATLPPDSNRKSA